MPLLFHDEQVRTLFKELLRRTCGFSFSQDREKSLVASLKKRMASRGIQTADSYYGLLLADQDELKLLVELLTVNETYFLREPEHLNLMVDRLVPELLDRRRCGPVRILSAGCSTGEEAYSVAMLLRDRYGEESGRLFSIVGVDIDTNTIAAARSGVYGKPSFRGMDEAMMARHFEPMGASEYRIHSTIRRQVRFEVLNLLGNFNAIGIGCVDIILYRNVSIYFSPDVQKKIFSALASLLNDGGILIVGATETLHHDLGILTLVERNGLFYYSKPSTQFFGERRSTKRHEPASSFSRPEGLEKTISVSSSKALTRHHPAAADTVVPAEKPPCDPKELFDRALELARSNRHEEALALLEAAIAVDHHFVKAHLLKASLLLDSASYGMAKATSETACALDPLCREAYLILGIVARHNGDDNDAFRRFREALYLDPVCWLAHFYTAEILYARQEYKRARNSYEKATEILEKGSLAEAEKAFFPLSFNAQQFITICRHKLSLLKEGR